MPRVLGLAEDEAEFAAVAERTKAAFNAHYVSPDGSITSDAVTVYAMAIAFGLLDPDTERRAGDRLADLVTENGFTIATGFAGTPYVTDALTTTGHVAEAYRLLLQTENPSWLYPVTMGATTIWERWDSMLPDGTINPGEMTSFNHYALGSVADWLHRTVAGLAPAEPGYRRVRVAPRIGGGLTWAHASLRSPSGEIAVGWRLRRRPARAAGATAGRGRGRRRPAGRTDHAGLGRAPCCGFPPRSMITAATPEPAAHR